MKPRTLFISQSLSNKTGGGLFSSVIENAIKNLSERYYIKEFNPNSLTTFAKIKNYVRGYLVGMSPDGEHEVMEIIEANRVNLLFVNSSYFGPTIRKVREECPEVKVVCFFHNVEYFFIRDSFRASRNMLSLPTLLVTGVCERLTAKYAHAICCLNERDSQLIYKRYGRVSDLICPLCLNDRFDVSKLYEEENVIGLFVGSYFNANIAGIKWFAENVSPHINKKILILGKDMEKLAQYLSDYPNLKLIGTVDSVDAYYYKASFIVSPIFLGSGMKTKTAEAMMFGKRIIGTREAFEGYDVDVKRIGAECYTAGDFIEQINNLKKDKNQFNEYSRSVYLANNTLEVICKKMKELIEIANANI